MPDEPVGCAKPTGKVIGDDSSEEEPSSEIVTKEEQIMVMVKVGNKAPDFEAPAYHKGKFPNRQLARGQQTLYSLFCCPSIGSVWHLGIRTMP